MMLPSGQYLWRKDRLWGLWRNSLRRKVIDRGCQMLINWRNWGIKSDVVKGKEPVNLGKKGHFPAKSFPSLFCFHATLRS